jgi:hypothetical protein
LSPSPDLISPDPNDLRVQRRYPRGIINPNYPGFQHLAHTLAEHFIDHHQFELSSDSEISEDFDFDVAYRSGNLDNANIMSEMNDSNNNNDINNGDVPDKNIDLNQNKNRRSICSKLENVVNDFGTMKELLSGNNKEYEDGNDNLLLKSEPKVFCESKQLGLNHENERDEQRFSSEDEDEECCNVVPNSFKSSTAEIDSNRMDFDEDDMADLSGEDDAAIKNELETIDKAENEFNENIHCDLATYLHQYDFKMDVQKAFEECLTDEDNSKLPTPDILIEHNNSSKLVNEIIELEEDVEVVEQAKHADVSPCDETRDYQPDLIKNITDAINTNDNNEEERLTEMRRQNGEGDNEISSPVEHEIPNETKTNDNDEKIINQAQTEQIEMNLRRNLPLSFESATSTTVDIIGDFGKEIEKEIGLIVSGYRNATNEMCSSELSSGKKAQQAFRPMKFTSPPSELVFDENKFIEHLKYFSKVSLEKTSNVFLPSIRPFFSKIILALLA